jgi:hypothetical protein
MSLEMRPHHEGSIRQLHYPSIAAQYISVPYGGRASYDDDNSARIEPYTARHASSVHLLLLASRLESSRSTSRAAP